MSSRSLRRRVPARCAVAAVLLMPLTSHAPVAAPIGGATASAPAPPPPDNFPVRVIGTASYQGRFTALLQDQNTEESAFYHEHSQMYGFELSEINERGVFFDNRGRRFFLAIEKGVTPLAPSTATPPPADADFLTAGGSPGTTSFSGRGLANLYLPEEALRNPRAAAALGASAFSGATPNFYLGPAGTNWDRWSPGRKLPGMANDLEAVPKMIAGAARRTADLLGSGLFSFPLTNYKRVSSPFGYRKHPIHGNTRMHKGIDLSANGGTRILAADAGTVSFSGWKGGYGRCLIIDHHNGYSTLYGHCSKVVAHVGDNVNRGEYVANVGSTGAATGNHLHFEVRKGDDPIDPAPFFF